MVGYIRGLKYNMAHPLEVVDKDWGRQLAIYGWLSGEEIGSEYLVAIDQIICGAGTVEGVAQHRCFVGADYQRGLYKRCCEIWRRCKSGHFWTQLSLEDSMARCKLLDQGPVTLEEERER